MAALSQLAAAVTDALKPRAPAGKPPGPVPPDIQEKLRRGLVAMRKDTVKRRLCQKFWEGDHYWFIGSKGSLNFQTAGVIGVVAKDKSQYRIRNTYNFIQSIVEAKVSAGTQRVPGYEVTPSTDDYEDEAAATLAQQVATFEYDNLGIRRHTTKAVTNALVQREGFVMPYFDPNVGPFEQQPDGTWQGKGEIRLVDLCRDEVMWEPGIDFEESRWHAIVQERLKDEVKQIPGYIEGAVETDDNDQQGDKPNSAMVTVTEYLERPSKQYPQGRRCFIAHNRIIVDYRRDPNAEPDWTDWWEPYSYTDANGTVADAPVLHRLSYTVNPNGDDLGLVERLIDLMRTINDCWNKLLEWKNRALMPQMSAPRGADVDRRDDTPGATFYYNLIGGVKPEWEQTPRVPQELFQMLQLAIEQMRALAADIDVQADPRLTSGTVNAAVEQSQARWQSFLGDLAEFHSRLMRHILCLVARYYDAQRQIDIRGQYGWQPISSFTGQDLRSQVNVRVLAGTLETKSRQTIQNEIQFVQTNWPGAITPEAALGTLHGGSAEGLIRSYENDVARAWRIIRRLRTGPDAMNTFGSRYDPEVPAIDLQTGQPIPVINPQTGLPNVDPMTGQTQQQMGMEVPGWMPAPWDNIAIWRQVIGDYMKTEDFEGQDPHIQEQFVLVWRGLDQADKMRAAKQAAEQQQQAQSLGMSNASSPQTPPPIPSRAGFTPDNASPVPQAQP